MSAIAPVNGRLCAHHRIVLCVALVLACGCGRPGNDAPPAPRVLEAQGAIGEALLYAPPDAPEHPPGLLLLRQEDGGAESWAFLAGQMRAQGFLGVAVTFRVLEDGASVNELLDAITPAWDALRSAGAAADNLAVLGTGPGANIALEFARREPGVVAAVLLSPGLTYGDTEATETVRALADCPLMIIAGEGDNYAAECARAIDRAAPGFSDIKLYPGAYQGVDLFSASSSARNAIVHWLDSMLRQGEIEATRGGGQM